MFLEVELKSIWGSLPEPTEDDYKYVVKIIRRQVKAETGWEVHTTINKEEK